MLQARNAFCDVLLCAVHTWCAAARADEACSEHGPVARVVQVCVCVCVCVCVSPA